MTPAGRFLDLFGGWQDARARYEAAPASCPCRAVSEPALAAWEAWRGRWNPSAPDLAGLAAQEAALADLNAAVDPPPPPPGSYVLGPNGYEPVSAAMGQQHCDCKEKA